MLAAWVLAAAAALVLCPVLRLEYQFGSFGGSFAAASSSSYTDSHTVYFDRPVYQGIVAYPCITYLNASAVVGCGGSAQGILYGVASDDDIDNFVRMNKHSKDYTVVTSHRYLETDVLRRLEATGSLAGVIILADEVLFPAPKHYSPDVPCPNCIYGLYANATEGSREEGYLTHKWNPYGNSIMQQHFGFPIFFIPITSAPDYLRNVVTGVANNVRNNYNNYPLFSAEFESKLMASVDSGTCLRRNWCRPVGGSSIWSTFSSEISPSDDKELIFLSTKIDSKAVFPEFAIGSLSVIPSIATSLGIAYTLSQSGIDFDTLNKHIVFSFFETESYGFSGSKRFVKDLLSDFECKFKTKERTETCNTYEPECSVPCMKTVDFTNITFDRITTFIELDSIGLISQQVQPTYFLHTFQNDSDIAKAFPSKITVNNTGLSTLDFKPGSKEFGLPPSSSMSFLSKNSNLDALVIADYNTTYLQSYYNSVFDSAILNKGLVLESLCSLSITVSKILLQQAGANTTQINSLSSDCTYLSQILDCLSEDFSCDLLYTVIPELSSNGPQIVRTNTGFFKYGASPMAYMLKHIMSNLTATKTRTSDFCFNDNTCKPGFTCVDYRRKSETETSISDYVVGTKLERRSDEADENDDDSADGIPTVDAELEEAVKLRMTNLVREYTDEASQDVGEDKSLCDLIKGSRTLKRRRKLSDICDGTKEEPSVIKWGVRQAGGNETHTLEATVSNVLNGNFTRRIIKTPSRKSSSNLRNLANKIINPQKIFTKVKSTLNNNVNEDKVNEDKVDEDKMDDSKASLSKSEAIIEAIDDIKTDYSAEVDYEEEEEEEAKSKSYDDGGDIDYEGDADDEYDDESDEGGGGSGSGNPFGFKHLTKSNVFRNSGTKPHRKFKLARNRSSNKIATKRGKEIDEIIFDILEYSVSSAVPSTKLSTSRSSYAASGPPKKPGSGAVGVCVRGVSRYHWSYSAGIEMDYKSKRFVVVDAAAGAWTESILSVARVRLFEVQSIRYQVMQFFVGLLFTTSTIVATWFTVTHWKWILS